jgi:transcription initiation factor IIE alpha subunit
MKIKVKHNLIIFENEDDWEVMREKIKQDFGETIFTISWRLKRELGFTVRYHRGLVSQSNDKTKFYYQDQVHLDFFAESSHSWFVLKYVNID